MWNPVGDGGSLTGELPGAAKILDPASASMEDPRDRGSDLAFDYKRLLSLSIEQGPEARQRREGKRAPVIVLPHGSVRRAKIVLT